MAVVVSAAGGLTYSVCHRGLTLLALPTTLSWGNDNVDDATRTELEAAAFPSLGFAPARAYRCAEHRSHEPGRLSAGTACRSGTALRPRTRAWKWTTSRLVEIVYGMPYGEWKDRFQGQATPEQFAKMNEVMAEKGRVSISGTRLPGSSLSSVPALTCSALPRFGSLSIHIWSPLFVSSTDVSGFTDTSANAAEERRHDAVFPTFGRRLVHLGPGLH